MLLPSSVRQDCAELLTVVKILHSFYPKASEDLASSSLTLAVVGAAVRLEFVCIVSHLFVVSYELKHRLREFVLMLEGCEVFLGLYYGGIFVAICPLLVCLRKMTINYQENLYARTQPSEFYPTYLVSHFVTLVISSCCGLFSILQVFRAPFGTIELRTTHTS